MLDSVGVSSAHVRVLSRRSCLSDSEAAEQGDEADEGRLEAGRDMVLGAQDPRRSRPSQLIASVRQT